MKLRLSWALLAGSVLCAGMASAAQIKVTVTNLSPAGGTFLTPLWVGFHDGGFDLYDLGSAISAPMERLAEDGNTGPLMTNFTASGMGAGQGTLGAAPFGPGESLSMTFTLDPMSASNRYFSYASMVVPSNDAFIANGNPLAFSIFSAGGVFQGADFFILGSMVNDAGSEVNDEIPMNTAFFGQATPDTGVVENGVVSTHLGFKPAGSGGILDDAIFANADFTASGYQIARIQVESVPDVAPVPEPSTLLLSMAGLAAALFSRTIRRA